MHSTPSHRLSFNLLVAGCLLVGLAFFLAMFTAVQTSQAKEEPVPTPTPLISPRQEQPVLPENPLLADKGHQVWWLVCMACHGDQGQGLTDEWRSTAFGEDMNCWQSKCHGKNHPPEGFEFPRIVPPAVGQGALRRFVTADQLQVYLLKTMPWWNPGSLTEEESWQLTAFLLREHGALPVDVEFDLATASTAPVHLPIHPHTSDQFWQWILLAFLGVSVVVMLALSAIKPRAEALPAAQNGVRPSFFHHLHPPTIPLPQARWRYTLGMGGLAVFLSLILGITGALEMFFYVPTPAQAGSSIQVITFLVPFGSLIRAIHYWAAQALVVVAVIHLLRVVFTGAYTSPRRINYLIGVALLVLTLLLDFTGYVLRWDEGIRWALMVGTNLLKTVPYFGDALYGFVVGGDQPGLAALSRFYTWHIFGLTLIMVIFVVWHIFRVRRDGGIAAPPPEQRSDPRRITRFELVRREALAGILALVGLILLGVLRPAPLAPPIYDAGLAPLSDVQAPWFFLWIQQLLRYGDAFWLGVAAPVGVLLILIVLPYLFPHMPESQKGSWFPRAGRAAQIIAAGLLVVWFALTVLELLP